MTQPFKDNTFLVGKAYRNDEGDIVPSYIKLVLALSPRAAAIKYGKKLSERKRTDKYEQKLVVISLEDGDISYMNYTAKTTVTHLALKVPSDRLEHV